MIPPSGALQSKISRAPAFSLRLPASHAVSLAHSCIQLSAPDLRDLPWKSPMRVSPFTRAEPGLKDERSKEGPVPAVPLHRKKLVSLKEHPSFQLRPTSRPSKPQDLKTSRPVTRTCVPLSFNIRTAPSTLTQGVNQGLIETNPDRSPSRSPPFLPPLTTCFHQQTLLPTLHTLSDHPPTQTHTYVYSHDALPNPRRLDSRRFDPRLCPAARHEAIPCAHEQGC
jgi:hypothetical protein